MSKLNILLSFIIISSSLLSSSYSSEVDSFNKRDTPLENSRELINKKANDFLFQAIINANKGQISCSEDRLYKKMRKYFRNHLFGKLSPYIINSSDIDKIVTPVKDSIYQDFKWFQAFVPGLIARLFKDPSGHIIRVDQFYVGTDKFEHFMGTGFRYFKNYHLKRKDLESVLDIGLKAETGIYGSFSTGVMSYADMVANFNGMRFWNQVLAKREDVLGEKFGPYVSCKNGDWKVEKPIDLSVYIDHAWDEGMNCSKFKNRNLTNKVLKQIKKFENKSNINLTCPISREKIELAEEKYGDLAKILINSVGHQSMK